MKTKRIIKGVAIIVSLLSMLSLFGCTNTKDQIKKDNEKAIEFLNKKYNKEFKISEEIHEVSSPTGEVARLRKGKAYCVDKPDEIFEVYVDSEDGDACLDRYQNITMRPYAQEYYEKIIKQYWNNCKVWIELSCMPTKDKIYSKDEYMSYLTNENGNIYINIYIESNGESIEKESEDIYFVGKDMKSKGLNGTLNFVYMKDNSKIDDEEIKNGKKFDDYIKEGIAISYCTVYINKKDELSVEEIKKSLDKK